MKEYHCLVAGLPDLFFDASKLGSYLSDFRIYLHEELDPNDYRLIETYFLKFDNQNLFNILKDTEKEFNTLGLLSREDLYSLTDLVKDDSMSSFEKSVPGYFAVFINAFRNELPLIPGKSWENQLTELYYEYACSLDNRFIAAWYRYEKDLANIATAFYCKKHGINPENELIGSDELTARLVKSNARDFGIGNEFPRIEQLFRILEESDLLTREKKLDLMKWELLDEWTFFHYFTVERIFSFIVKLGILERWIRLDAATGQEMFDKLLTGLETGFMIPEEFSQKH